MSNWGSQRLDLAADLPHCPVKTSLTLEGASQVESDPATCLRTALSSLSKPALSCKTLGDFYFLNAFLYGDQYYF